MVELAEKAHDMAVEAKQDVYKLKQKQESHEEICGLRYEHFIKMIEAMDGKMSKHLDRIYGRDRSNLMAIITFLVLLIVSLISYIYINTSDGTENRITQLEQSKRVTE